MKDLKADSSVLPGWIGKAWQQLRQAMLIGAFAAGIVVTFLNWWRETFPPPEPVTAEQMSGQMEDMQAQVVQLSTIVVHNALQSYTDSLNRVRRNLEDSVARPVFKAILDLDRRMTRLERGQQATVTALEAQRVSDAVTNEELLSKLRDNSREDRLMEAMNNLLNRIDNIERQLPPKKRTTKQEM